MSTVVSVENLSKSYRLGQIGTGTFANDLKVWSAKLRGKPNPLLKIDETDYGNRDGEIIWALNDVSFTVEHGEVLGIIGKNGAGKSTLLKIISQVTSPTRGYVKVKGRIASLLEVGTGFHPELTGRENIYLNGAILGMSKDEIRRKYEEIVDFSGVAQFIDTPVKRYSSGMYVRLAFAIAAHLEPEILLVDEVLAVGDAEFQKKCLGKMGNVAQGGRTVLFVSHNMVAVQSICKSAIRINHGLLVEQGQAGKVISNYLNDYNTASSEQIWSNPNTAPGNDKVRIRRVCIKPENGRTSEQITMETPIAIEIEFWNRIPDARLHITLHVSTDQGVVAFTTGSSQEPGWSEHTYPEGLFKSTCRIPGNFLNSGLHQILLLVVQDTARIIYQYPDIVSFDVLDLTERQGAWFGREPGAVYPKLEWHTEFLTDKE